MQKSISLQSYAINDGPSGIGSSMLRALNFQIDTIDEESLFDIPVSPQIRFENTPNRILGTTKSKRKASLKSSAG